MLGLAHRPERRGHGAKINLGKCIEQRPVPRRRKQSTIIMLPVDLDQHRANLAEQRARYRLIIHKRTTAAIGLHRAANDQRFAGVCIEIVGGERGGDLSFEI